MNQSSPDNIEKEVRNLIAGPWFRYAERIKADDKELDVIRQLIDVNSIIVSDFLSRKIQEAIAGERERLIREFTEEAVVMTPMDASDLADTEEDSKPFVYLDDAIDLLTPTPDTSKE